MLRITLKLFFMSAKLVLRVFAILGGLVLASLGNAASTMLDANSDSDPEEHSSDNSFVVDEHGAQRAYNEGRMTAFQAVYFNED